MAAAAEGTTEAISQKVASIMAMGQGELEIAWGTHCRGRPPAGLPRSLLARLLAYKVQAAVHGDLSPTQQRFFERVAREVSAGTRNPNLQLDDRFQLKPGTVLVREHGGEQQRVMVLADGFAWNGEVHKSLSAVASAITGTRWNGHRFFGLNDASRIRRSADIGGSNNGARVSGVSP
jgi:Protein of unknown function (DUF2924)